MAEHPSKKPSIAIIGGGMAGLAAAATLIKQDKQVTLFEASTYLGGRARGLNYKDVRIDNGQHILLGAYRDTLALLKQADIQEPDAIMRLPLTLTVKDAVQTNTFSLQAHPRLPAPLHILWGLLSANGVSIHEKLSAISFMVKMKLKGFKLTQDQSVLALLKAHQQSPTFIQYLWDPLCLAALNTSMKQASAQVFLNVLKDSFSKKKSDADALLPKTDLSTLMSAPIAEYLSSNDCHIRTNQKISTITPLDGGYQIDLGDEQQHFSHIVLACGPHQLKALTPSLPKLTTITEHFSYQPITTVYLQYSPETRLNKPMTGAVNSLSQWVFDRGIISGQLGLIAVVISAHAPFTEPKDVIAATVAKELKQLFPSLAEPEWHKVITEKRATFSCDVGLVRPDNATDYPNLFLAGDYTAGDYPATIEGAVRSGIKSANLILESV